MSELRAIWFLSPKYGSYKYNEMQKEEDIKCKIHLKVNLSNKMFISAASIFPSHIKK